MAVETTEVVVVGGGQAGIAMSEHLMTAGVPHVVLEKARTAEKWRSGRWDSLVMNGPAWHDRFPNLTFEGFGPNDFPGKEAVADYLESYAHKFNAPIRNGVEVKQVVKNEGRPGFRVTTSEGEIDARYVVAATGPFQVPVIPPVVHAESGLHQIHSADYHNPEQLPEGAVLVIGAGSSGVQIAEELRESGRQVYLAVGPHDRPPRRYRDRDFVWWLGVLNKWEASAPPAGAEHVTIAVSGARGGKTVDFRELAERGIVLLGMAGAYRDGVMQIADDLVRNVNAGDENYLSLLREADDFVERNGLELPPEPDAHDIRSDPQCMTDPVRSLDFAGAGITSIVWATGYTQDYNWLKVDATDEAGRPVHQRGVSREPGVYFLGLPWQSRRGSSFIWGVWHDAKHLNDHIAIQRSYLRAGSASDVR